MGASGEGGWDDDRDAGDGRDWGTGRGGGKRGSARGGIARRFPEEIKLALLEAETWADFQEFELELKEEGMEPRSARRAALARYCPDELLPAGIGREEADPEKVKRWKPKNLVKQRGKYARGADDYGGAEPKPKRKPKTKRDSAPPDNLDEGGDGDTDQDGGEEGGDGSRDWPDIGGLVREAKREESGRASSGRGRGKAKAPDELPELPAVTRTQFRRKEANEIEVIRWVARNMDIRDVKPADCPDAAAWRLLKKCRESKLFEQLFWQSMWTKVVPSRTQLEKEAGPSEMDGTQEIATIDKIRVAAQKAKDADAEAEKEAVEKMMSRRGEMASVGGKSDDDDAAGLGL